MPSIKIKRGTRAQIAAAATANALQQSELYHVTDENRIDLGTGAGASVALAKKSEVPSLPLALVNLAQSGANVGDSIVWDGTSWVAGQPLPGSWTDAYAFLMDAGNTGPDLEAYLGVSENYFGFTALLARYEWLAVCDTASAAAMFAASSTAMAAVAASSAAMTAVTASSTAMTAVAASSTAMTAVAASSTAMASVIASSTAMTVVAASSTAMTAVIASSTAMTAVIASSTAMTAVAASSTAMAAVAASSTAMTAVIASSTALAAVFANSGAKAIFKASTALTVAAIPQMTSNTAPSGTAAASTYIDTTVAAWKALDKYTDTAWISAAGATTNQWLSYDFGAARYIHTAKIGTQSTTSYQLRNFRIEYSDNNLTWTTVATGTKANEGTEESYEVIHAGAHRYWRLFAIDRWGLSNYIGVSEFNLLGFILP